MMILTVAYCVVAFISWPIFAVAIFIMDRKRWPSLTPSYMVNAVFSLFPAAIWPAALPVGGMAYALFKYHCYTLRQEAQVKKRRQSGKGIEV